MIAETITYLQAAGIDAHDGRPTRTPPTEYAFVVDRAPLITRRRLNVAPAATSQIAVTAVSRDRDRCRNLATLILSLLDGWHPLTATEAGPLRQVDASDMLTDGPADDVRHSQTIIFRCAVPRGQQ